MKKLLALLLSLTLVFTLVACAEEATPAPEPTPTPAPTPEPTPAPVEEQATSLTGFVNYKFADATLRNTFMAAAEKYLFDVMAGIPLYDNAGYVLYNERLQLPLDEYLPVVGYGTGFGTMSADDSTVEIEEGLRGNAGEYTYRTAVPSNPTSYNQYIIQDAVSSDILGLALGSFYSYVINSSNTGFELVPSAAASLPEPVGGRETETGRPVSRTWRVDLREDLEWYYNEDTDTSGFPADHKDITAEDFIETWEIALTNKWFRAVSGGGDFVTSSTAVVGAGDFSNGLVPFDQVGLKAIDDYTLEFQFINEQSEWNVRYWLSGFTLMPINVDLYNALGGATGTYGVDEASIAYNGFYYVDFYEPDKTVRLKANPDYFDTDEFFYTGYNFQIIEDSDIAFQEFLEGRLESRALPTSRFEEFRNDPRIRLVPGAVVFRLGLNGTGSRAAQQQQWDVIGNGEIDPNANPEPIMASVDFRKALYFAIDRDYLAYDVVKTVTPGAYFFTPAYVVEPEDGVPFRNTPQGVTVNADYSPSTYGFNPDAARALFDQALAPLVANGTYQEGDVIDLLLVRQAGSELGALVVEYLQTVFEETFVSERYGISVQITPEDASFPNNYFDYILPGVSDMGVGGISGGTLDAAGFLDQFRYDNKGGFVLSWGMDTREANIPVRYEFLGEERYEMWSFDAIEAALNGEVYLLNGAEANFPAPTGLEFGFATASFSISNFFEPQFTNIRYSLEVEVDGVFEVVPGFEDVTPANRFVSFTDLQRGTSYRIVVEFGFADEPTRTETTTAEFTTNE
jgi:ABC-type oligopeptide transport system substrate-binding subunit